MATQSRIGWRPYVSQVVNAVDADAQAFIAAAGITDLTQAAAISTLVNDLKTYGLWSKMKALYPFVGGNATSHKFNLKDPRDLDAAYRLVFSGGWVHSSTGALPNGTTGYADTKLIPNQAFTNANDLHISSYSLSDTTGGNKSNGVYLANNISDLALTEKGMNNNFGTSIGSENGNDFISVSNTDSRGHYVSSRLSNTSFKAYKNSVLVSTNTNTTNNLLANRAYFISAINTDTQGITWFNDKKVGFHTIGFGLTDNEAFSLYISIQKFQTTLGRQVGTPYVSDADAVSFLTVAGITDGTQAAAINTLVIDLKAAGVWTKMKALYPFVGGTATSHKFNLKDPRDLDTAYRLVFSGGWVHSSTGAKPNGINTYADTKLTPNAMGQNSIHASFYSRTDIAGYYWDLGAYDAGGGVVIGPRYQNGASYVYMNTKSNDNTADNNPTIGLYMGNRTSSTANTLFRNGVIIVNGTKSSFTPISLNIYLGADNEGTVVGYSPREQAFASIGDGLSDIESANFYTSVQKFQTTLGRQVNTPVVSDSDAQTFLNAAGITSYTQANAVNTLVVDLKAAGIWSKMKAIYPFVGGTSTSHKFNLKDPRDLDAAYRLVFNGGWVHSSTGALPNGTTGYADTKLKPTDMAQNSAHMSTYLRTQYDGGFDMGVSTNLYFLLSANLGTSIAPVGNLNVYVNSISYPNLSTQAFFLASRTNSTTNKIFRNTSLLSNNTSTSIAPEAYNIYLGAANRNNSGWQYSYREQAFSSIGDGLSDTEATSFYTAVQKFQTALGRQVGTPVYNTNGLVLNLDAGVANSYPGTGTTWFDLASGNNATLVNGPTYDINNGGSILFDGVNDNVTFGSNCFGVALNDTISEFTINVWVNWNSFPNNTHDEIVSWWASGTQTYLDGFLGLSTVSYLGFTNTNPTLRFGDGWQDTGVRFNSSTDKNKWWNITAIKTATNAYIYLNGVLVSTKGSALSWGFNNVLNIGSQFTAGEYLNGKLSSVSLYNRALSATEVLQNFNSSRGRFGV